MLTNLLCTTIDFLNINANKMKAVIPRASNKHTAGNSELYIRGDNIEFVDSFKSESSFGEI